MKTSEKNHKPVRIYAAGLSTETNCFAPFPTTYESFVKGGIWHGNASDSDSFVGGLVACWRELAQIDRHSFFEGIFAIANPAGSTTRSAYERLRDEILAQADQEGPFDVALLFLHGAMVADGYEDCEGDIIKLMRDRLGSKTIIGVILDPHCHLSSDMVTYSDILVLAKEYPHTDYPQRMSELYKICLQVANNHVKPFPAVFDCKMIGFYPTTTEPMSDFVRLMQQAERQHNVLSVSFIHGFELGDTHDTGSKVLVYTNGDTKLAKRLATELGTKIYQLRHKLLPSFMNLEEALALVNTVDKPVILADVGDNPGAGYASDNMNIVRALIERKVEHVVAGCFWDPVVAELCMEVGPGARLKIRLGGKSGPTAGMPLDIEALIMATKEDHKQSVLEQGTVSFGKSVWLRVNSIDIVVTSKPCQVFSQNAFTDFGIELKNSNVITLKSGQHFYESFVQLGGTILYVNAPDTVGLALREIPHQKLVRDYFPIVLDPLGLDEKLEDYTITEI